MEEHLCDLGDERVQIFVGAERKEFSVHKNLIRRSGDFFEAAFQENGFKEGLENKMDLPEDKPYIFQAFVDWMYSKQAGNLPKRNLDLENEQGHAASSVELYIFADKYRSEKLMNFSMDSLQDALAGRHGHGLALEEVKMIFDFTKDDPNHRVDDYYPIHPLRRFAVDAMAHDMLDGLVGYDDGYRSLEKVLREVDGALLDTMFLVKDLYRNRTYVDARIRGRESPLDICEYHRHKSIGECDSLPNFLSRELDDSDE